AADREIAIGGWAICDEARHCFTFPRGTVVPPGRHAEVFTGTGRGGGLTFYMGSRSAVWNNGGDVATLRDERGRIVARYAW
ncbi:MAG: lamin tail domain-containing protein, partial [Longimicrobiales bacterium]|nr:lamin tail domain-containing protein [Longimicrobiales bacterium]